MPKPIRALDRPPGPDRDHIFAKPRPVVGDFAFDTETATVFDDMVGRSVPFYHEIQRMLGELVADLAGEHGRVFDLGCATGTTLALLDGMVPPAVSFVGIDNSQAMLARAGEKLGRPRSGRSIELRLADINDAPVDDASVVLMILTLQFVRPMLRERVVRRIREGMRDKSCLILVEKLTISDTSLNRLYIKHYYDLKRRNGYSDLEIAQKREALENVLIPYRFDENRELLLNCGFKQAEEFFRWYNFCGIVALL